MFKVSVVITTYNDEKYLDCAIQSVLKQSYEPVEIIIVDDGSDNFDAKDIVFNLAKNTVIPMHYFYKINGGPSSARNYGVTKSVGDYIAFLDADDIWLPDNLVYKTLSLSKFDRTDKLFGVYGSFIFSDSKINQEFRQIDTADPINNLTDSVGKKDGIPGGLPSYLISKKAYEEVGGLDEKLTINEDFDLIIRFILAGYIIFGDSHPGFIRTMREESLTRNNNHLLTYSRIDHFLKKAEKMNYFSKLELQKRRYKAALSTAKKILSVNFYDSNGLKLLILGLLIALNIK
jgi:glycosyltransferase involved in cell wall biosynthesis